MNFYNAYGLVIRSDLLLPELIAEEEKNKTDVVIHFGKIEGWQAEVNGTGPYLCATTDTVYLYWAQMGAFLVHNGCEIIIDPLPDIDEQLLHLPLLGPVLAMLLYQRGHIVLHASAVAINGGAIAFVGGKGSGKSTIAAALCTRGQKLVADDIVALTVDRETPMILPGFPQFKLWPESVIVLGESPDELSKLHPTLDKRACRVSQNFSQISLPLYCIYMLETGPTLEIEIIPPQKAWLTLLPHWYGARFGKRFLQDLGHLSHFIQCTKLANQVAFCRLRRPRSIEMILDVAQLVEKHLASDVQPVTG